VHTLEIHQQISTKSYLELRNGLDLEANKFRLEILKTDSRYSDPKNLNRYESTIFSQCGEDGIIQEIFRRIGTTNRFFVEFGAGNGLQNCTTTLLLQNWIGLWIEADEVNAQTILNKFSFLIRKYRLTFQNVRITPDNIEKSFEDADVPEEFDLLSIDIDGNDYWVWKAITRFNPRVVICEYNGRFGPDIQWVMEYTPHHIWKGSCYFGASLKSFQILAKQKGYTLVGCSMSGVNAFFVRNDLIQDFFCQDDSTANHFEPQRFFLIREPNHYSDFGPFVMC
jgi:hypothetical protein